MHQHSEKSTDNASSATGLLIIPGVVWCGLVTLLGFLISGTNDDQSHSSVGAGLVLETFIGASVLLSVYALYLATKAYADSRKTDSFKDRMLLNHIDTIAGRPYSFPLAILTISVASFAAPVIGEVVMGDVGLETLAYAAKIGGWIAVAIASPMCFAYLVPLALNICTTKSTPKLQN